MDKTAAMKPFNGWNREIKRLQDLLKFFQPRARKVNKTTSKLRLNNDWELQYTVLDFEVGGIYEINFPSFIVELIDPVPVLNVNPKVYTYYKGTYSEVFEIAKSMGWNG